MHARALGRIASVTGAQYFRLPLDVRFLIYYWLPARPPLFNVLVSYWLSAVAFSFPLYQLAVAATGLLTALPVFLFARKAGRKNTSLLLLTGVLLALSPMFLQNTLFPWTRQFNNFLVLTGLYFYWRGIFADRMVEVGLAMVIFATAVLTHYSAAPYALVIGGHLYVALGAAARTSRATLVGVRCRQRGADRYLDRLVSGPVWQRDHFWFAYHGHGLARP